MGMEEWMKMRLWGGREPGGADWHGKTVLRRREQKQALVRDARCEHRFISH